MIFWVALIGKTAEARTFHCALVWRLKFQQASTPVSLVQAVHFIALFALYCQNLLTVELFSLPSKTLTAQNALLGF
jgi:hypothetical protein